MKLWLAWLAWHVSLSSCCRGYGRLGGHQELLLDGLRGLGSIHCSSRRSGIRHPSTCEPASISSGCCLRSRCPSRWSPLECNPGSPCGTGLQVGKADPLPEGRRQLGPMGRCRPLASSKPMDRKFTNSHPCYSNRRSFFRKEAEAVSSGGSSRRQRVHDCGGSPEGQVVSTLHRCDGWTTRGGMRTILRAIISVASEGLHSAKPSIHRLWSIWALWEKIVAVLEIQNIRLDTGGLHHEGNPRPSKFCSLEGVIPGVQNSHDHDGHHQCRELDGLRRDDRTLLHHLSHSLAFGGDVRGQCESRACNETQDEADSKHGERRPTSTKVGPSETLGLHLPSDDRGRKILEGATSYTSFGVVGRRRERAAEDSIRENVLVVHEGRHRHHDAPEGEHTREKSNYKQEEEEVPRRIPKPKAKWRTLWRISQKQRKGQKRKRATVVLRVERQHWSMWWAFPWFRVQSSGQERTSVHEMQVSGPSCTRMPNKEGMKHPKTNAAGEGEQASGSKDVPGGGEGNSTKRSRSFREENIGWDSEDSEMGTIRRGGKPFTLQDYLAGRKFKFLHHFAGPRDPLGKHLKERAEGRINLEVISVDKLSGGGDLRQEQPYAEHLAMAKRGELDGFHAGFPCATYSRLRWRDAPGLPGPVRSKTHPYGLKSNNASQQKECDNGTILASRSVKLATQILENPPPSELPEHLSAWELPEVKDYLRLDGVKAVDFVTCAYEHHLPPGKRHWKPQRFAGTLYNIGTLGLFPCSCGEGVKHEPIVGVERSRASAEYPEALCKAYAILVIEHFEKMAKEEFLREKMKYLEERKTKRQKNKGEPNKIARNKTSPEAEREPIRLTPAPASKDWIGDPTKKHGLFKAMPSKKEAAEQEVFVGGMRNPAVVVKGLPVLQNLGVKVKAAWEGFVRRHPKALEVAENYGTLECEYNETVTKEWIATLKRTLGARAAPKARKEEHIPYRSPLDPEILQAWIQKPQLLMAIAKMRNNGWTRISNFAMAQ